MGLVLLDNSPHRQSNFELLRLISMLLVLVFHGFGVSLGIPSKIDFQLSPAESSIRVFIESLSLICVNVFVLISGWFGINPKIKKLASFLFQCLFFSIIVSLIAPVVGIGSPFSIRDLGSCFFFGKYYYWFVKSYLCLYILSPVLNAFVQSADKSLFLIVLIGFFLVQTLYGWTGSMADFDRGYSVISFVGLYLLARYIRLYGGSIFSLHKWLDLAIYIGLSVAVAALYIVAVNVGIEKLASHIFLYINPLAVLASVFFLLFFSKIELNNRTINYLSRSAFAVYLFHLNAKIWDAFRDTCYDIYTSNTGSSAFLLVFCFLVSVFIVAIIIDQIRLLCWRPVGKGLTVLLEKNDS